MLTKAALKQESFLVEHLKEMLSNQLSLKDEDLGLIEQYLENFDAKTKVKLLKDLTSLQSKNESESIIKTVLDKGREGLGDREFRLSRQQEHNSWSVPAGFPLHSDHISEQSYTGFYN